jgi:hypothetical protein
MSAKTLPNNRNMTNEDMLLESSPIFELTECEYCKADTLVKNIIYINGRLLCPKCATEINRKVAICQCLEAIVEYYEQAKKV